jgi:arylsulfatase A-like enzyme
MSLAFTLLTALLLAPLAALHAADTPDAATRPNIVFILADDLGYADLGCYGSTFYETPNIDRLASRGVRLTQAYAASPLCSPTRSSILTGQYPARTGITSPACHVKAVQLEKKLAKGWPGLKALNAESLTRLKTEYVTLAEALREEGYATAHFGKWHLGHNLAPGDRYEPRDQGFDVDFPHTPSVPGPGGGYLAPWKFIKDKAITGQPGEHIEDRMSAEAATFIRAHKDRPFYVNYWAYSVHSPWNARQDYIDHFKQKADKTNPQHNPLYAAMVKSLDDGVGRLLKAVEEAGVADRTILVFFSDNGGWAFPPKATDPEGFGNIPATSNLPLRSGKASLYEGGTREPCVIVWPGKTKPGTASDALFQSVDWYPTLLAMCGVKPHAGLKLDGVDQTSVLLGQAAVRDRVFCHFPHGSPVQAANIPGFLPGTSVRKGDWKLIRFFADNDDGSDRLELFNLKDDIGETKNLVAAKPELVRELNELITGFLRDTEAVVPVRNPGYNPNPAARGEGKDAVPSGPLQGWVARNCDARVKDGIVTMTGTGDTPFLGVTAGGNGPAVVKLRARCTRGGDGRIEWLNPKEPSSTAKSVPFALPGGDWQDITVSVPAEGPFPVLRVHLPAQKQPVEVDFIELDLRNTTQPRRWDF